MVELDRGRAGQDKRFWENVALEFNDYSPEKVSHGSLVVTSAYDKKLSNDKNVEPSIKGGAMKGTSTKKKRKTPADVLEKYPKEKAKEEIIMRMYLRFKRHSGCS